MALTRYEKSRLKFCARQNDILARRMKEAEYKADQAQAEYRANSAELKALEAKRDAN